MVRTAVIGTGAMGRNHVRVYSEISELVGIADINADAVGELSKKFGVGGYTDYKELLSQGIDAVSIALPTEHHHKVALEFINAGIGVLVEKPIAVRTV